VRWRRGDRVVQPGTFPVQGRTGGLLAELRWYLEDFLEYPFSPDTERAERVLAALDAWARAAFAALFDERDAGTMLAAAVRDGYAALRLQIRSDDPSVLAWPWEALHDPQAGPLGQVSQAERRLDAAADPAPLDPHLPRDRVHILLVTARPYDRDVGYRSISRPLVEMIARRALPAEIHLLRPPTFARLRDHLRERPHHYHILHFDGHGAYGAAEPPAGLGGDATAAHRFAGPSGCLVFEDAAGGPHAVSAATLAPLLREMALPVVVLNACQSAMLNAAAPSAFASIARPCSRPACAAWWRWPTRSMSVARRGFLPELYRRLFESGSVAGGAHGPPGTRPGMVKWKPCDTPMRSCKRCSSFQPRNVPT
jgi:hypothetical protein